MLSLWTGTWHLWKPLTTAPTKGPEGNAGLLLEAMVELVRWRKKVGRKERLPLNDAIVHKRAATVDYPEMIADVLEKGTNGTDGTHGT